MLTRQLKNIQRFFIEVKNLTQFQSATKNHPNHIIQFTASWCGPCKQLSPVLYKKEKEGERKWTVIKIDVDQEGNGEICQKYQLEAVPKLVFVKEGKEVQQTLGAVNSQRLDELINLIK